MVATAAPSPFQWFIIAVKKYAVFSGRARRQEFWYFALFYAAIGLGLALLSGFVLGAGAANGLLSLYMLALLLPNFAVAVRRLHDTGRNAWWLLIAIVPFVGGLVLLFLCAQDSVLGPNQYGPNPKGA